RPHRGGEAVGMDAPDEADRSVLHRRRRGNSRLDALAPQDQFVPRPQWPSVDTAQPRPRAGGAAAQHGGQVERAAETQIAVIARLTRLDGEGGAGGKGRAAGPGDRLAVDAGGKAPSVPAEPRLSMADPQIEAGAGELEAGP